MNEALPWLSSCFDFLLSVGLLVVALTAVRSTHATSGYLLAGAGAVDLLAICCLRGENYAARSFGVNVLLAFNLLTIFERLIYFGLIIGAAFTLSSAVLARRGAEPT